MYDKERDALDFCDLRIASASSSVSGSGFAVGASITDNHLESERACFGDKHSAADSECSSVGDLAASIAGGSGTPESVSITLPFDAIRSSASFDARASGFIRLSAIRASAVEIVCAWLGRE
jgi:hypothetical protein